MKVILTTILLFNSLLWASSNNKSDEKEKRAMAEKQLQIEIKKEEKYSRERTFYQQSTYDFKGAQVNPASVDSVPDIEVDDFDMDSVYD